MFLVGPKVFNFVVKVVKVIRNGAKTISLPNIVWET
jgi:hypothetical protein